MAKSGRALRVAEPTLSGGHVKASPPSLFLMRFPLILQLVNVTHSF